MRIIAALGLFLLLVSVAVAAPGFPWSWNVWDDQAIGTTEISQSVTLENATVGHAYYHLAAGYTNTNSITVTEGYDGEVLFTQTASAATDATTEASGVITLSMTCPDIGLAISTDTGAGVVTVGLWQR